MYLKYLLNDEKIPLHLSHGLNLHTSIYFVIY